MEAPKPVADRYRFLKALRGSSKTLIWLATDDETNQTVVASLLPKARAAGIKPLTQVTHPHLAKIHAVVEKFDRDSLPSEEARADGAVVIAEYVPGRTLHQRLESGSLDPNKAVQVVMRLAKALRAIHDKGGVHGAVSPRSVIVTRAELGVVPVLTQLLAAPNGAYCSPERVTGGGPSKEDDTWALHSTLYAALTGRPPFSGESRKELARMILAGKPVPLSAFGVEDPELQTLLTSGVTGKPDTRVSTVKALETELATWSRRSGGDSPPPSQAPPSIQLETVPDEKPGDTAPPPPAVDDEGITEAVLEPTSPNANLKTSVYAMPAQRPSAKKKSDDPPPDVEVKRPSIHDQEDILMALASQPSAAEGGDQEPRLVEDDDDSEGDRPTQPRTDDVAKTDDVKPASKDSEKKEDKKTSGNDEKKISRAGVEKKPAKDNEKSKAPAPEGSKKAAKKKPAAAREPEEETKSSGGLWIYALLAVLVVVGIVYAKRSSDEAGPSKPTPTATTTTDPSPTVTTKTTAAPTNSAAPMNSAVPANGALPISSAAPMNSAAPDAASSAGPKPSAAPTPTAAPTAAPTATPTATAAPTPTAAAAPKGVGECVAQYYPEATFKNADGFEFVCELTDPRKVATKMHSKIVVGGLGKLTEGMRIWSQLSWYEMASVSVARAGCCPSAAPLKLPHPSEACPDLAAALTALGVARTKNKDASIEIMAFHDTVGCYFDKNYPKPYRYKQRPSGPNRTMFEGLIEDAPTPGN